MGATKVWTDDELMRLPDDGYKYELVDGALVVSPAGGRHGRTIVRLTLRLGAFVVAHGLGEVFDSSTGYRLPGGNLRVPDLSFVARSRLPGGRAPIGFLYVAPDLAVEVLSLDDRPRLIADKVGEYLAAGVRLVWVIDPERGERPPIEPTGRGWRSLPMAPSAAKASFPASSALGRASLLSSP